MVEDVIHKRSGKILSGFPELKKAIHCCVQNDMSAAMQQGRRQLEARGLRSKRQEKQLVSKGGLVSECYPVTLKKIKLNRQVDWRKEGKFLPLASKPLASDSD